MIPTAYLRFIERIDQAGVFEVRTSRKVLQQWWADHSCDAYVIGNPGGSAGEWRDVEQVEE